MSLPANRPKRAFGIAGVAFAAFGLLAAFTIGPSPAPASVTASAPPRCETSGLDIWLESEIGGGVLGGVYYRFQFTNFSGHACTLSGYPKVVAVSLAGRRIGSPAAHDRAERRRLVRLAPGGSAPALIRVSDVGSFSPSACRPVSAAGFRVYPPGNAASRLVPFPFRVCSKVGNGNMAVRVVGSK